MLLRCTKRVLDLLGSPPSLSFERRLAEAGVELINTALRHPETLGKLERSHRTLKGVAR